MDSAVEKLDRVVKNVEAYENNKGLLKTSPPEGVSKYMKLSRGDISAMSLEECDFAAYQLSVFAYTVQRAQNEEKGKLSWVDNNLNLMVARKVDNYKGFSYEERKAKAINDSEAMQQLAAIRLDAEMRSEHLAYLSQRIDAISRIFLEIRRNKAKHDPS